MVSEGLVIHFVSGLCSMCVLRSSLAVYREQE